ncbi:MAG: NADP-dependent phosphogluconate dehydrogenase [Capsulimonadaceae bacterium]|nr:NADP-dependent phosphogluconate dehydrogenase [Capsulimonadaceae bacterium]
MALTDFGLTGLAVMGANLARNVAHKGFSISVHNRTTAKTDEFIAEHGDEGSIVGTKTTEEFVQSIRRPRPIMIMVKAGAPVDAVIAELVPLLDKGDILIDGGNSYFTDTQRRERELKEKGILFIGTGVSGGEEGALNGPSIMPGGQPEAYARVEPIFTKIAAQVDGTACCTHIGSDGAGHYVKMVHNGIEYADMQLIAEAYDILRSVLGLSAGEISKVFREWNNGDLDSFLIQITYEVLEKIDDETGKPLVDLILDSAAQKGTGKWTSQNSLDLGIPVTTITEAVFARFLSALKDERVKASKILPGPPRSSYVGSKDALIAQVRDALYASKVCCYAQGFQLMDAAAAENGWTLNRGEIATIWRGGCIIRAQFLNRIKEAYDQNPELSNLLLAPYFTEAVDKGQAAWRRVIGLAAEQGIPVPAFSSALAYYDSYRRDRLPANLLQGLRDYFGAHTYKRLDKDGDFHTQWAP